RQPGETHASEAARTMKASIGSLSPRSARHPQQRTAPPYAQGSGGASDEPLTPTPNSARAYYQGAMCSGSSPIPPDPTDDAGEFLVQELTPRSSGGRPRGATSPRQAPTGIASACSTPRESPGGLASARRRGWVLEDASTGEAGAGGSACSPPAGAYYQSGSAAAALEAAAVEAEGLNSPAEPLMV
ncbi:unnamed protein product, partial [Polarella glacialis]